jgi:hypothetical protein
MKRYILWILGVVLVFGTGYWAGKMELQSVHAQNILKASVPKSWGHFTGLMTSSFGAGLVFEDSAGVVRISDMDGKLIIEVTRN